MTEANNALAAQLPESVFKRSDSVQKENVMDLINSLKVYNAQPGKAEDPTNAGSLMLKGTDTVGLYAKFTDSVGVNILKVRKGINGMFNLLDENNQVILDGMGQTKKGFAFTEEYGRYTRNDFEVMFKSPDIKGYSRMQLGELKKNLKTAFLPNGRKNPFHKMALDQNSLPYDSSHLNESYIVYGVFTDGARAGEYFRLFMSSSAFGQQWDPKTKVTTIVKGSLAECIDEGQKQFNAIKSSLPVGAGFDDSLINTKLSVVKSGNFYKPEFSNTSLITKDNTEDVNIIEDLLKKYREQEFSGIPSSTVLDSSVAGRIGIETNTVQKDVANNGYYTPTVDQRQDVINQPVVNEVINKPEPLQQKTQVQDLNKQNDMISIEDIPF